MKRYLPFLLLFCLSGTPCCPAAFQDVDPNPAPIVLPDPVPVPDPIFEPTPASPDLPVAAIDVSDSRGNPVTDEIGFGQLLVLSSDKAVHANVEGSLNWIVEPGLQTFSTDGGRKLVINTGLQPTTLRVMQIVSTRSGRNAYSRIIIRIGGGQPVPPGPGPNPNPGPQPEPDPIVDPQPEFGNLQVLIIEETSQRPALPADQQTIIASPQIRAYAKEACSKGADGKTPDFRIFDKDVQVTREPEWLKTAFATALTDSKVLPWIVLSNGTAGYSGPLPANEEETLALLKKFGGER